MSPYLWKRLKLHVNTADITGPGVSGAVGHSYRSKPPSQRSRDTQRRNKWYDTEQKEHIEGDVTSLYFQNESNSQTLLTGAKCRSVILGGDLKDSNITLTQLPQSTDQNMQVKVGGVEPVGSPVNAVNVGKSGENTNSEDIQDASHYPCNVCHTLISIAANTECWTCTLCDDFAFCKQCQEQGLHT